MDRLAQRVWETTLQDAVPMHEHDGTLYVSVQGVAGWLTDNAAYAPPVIDTSNDFMVGGQGSKIVVLQPLRPMEHAEALRLAAWLVALVGNQDEFDKVLRAVLET